MWNNEKLLSAAMIFVGAFSILGALKLPLTEEFTLGAGALPLIYAVGVIAFAVVMWFNASPENLGSLKRMLTPPGRNGFLLWGFNILLAFSVYFIGFTLGLFLFSFFSLVFAGKWKPLRAVVFSAAWTTALYIIFVRILNIPFLTGSLFGE